MKILFNIDNMGKGGAERVMSNLCNYFAKENDVSLICTTNVKMEYDLDKKIRYYYLNELEKKNNNFVIRNIMRVYNLNRLVKKINPDVIISFLPDASFLMLASNFINRKKIIISVRSDPNVEFKNPIKKILMKILYSRANGFVFQTNDARNYFPKRMTKNSTIILNPVSSEFFIEPFLGNREKEIVTVGRLDEGKNQRLLINAFCLFEKKYPNFKLRIYGDGPEKENLNNLIIEKGMEEKIKLMGKVSDVKEKIYKASMFAFSSNFEGLPNALMEAIALGIPSISTDCPCGGPAYLINNNENGILVPVNDVEAMADAFDRIANDKKLSNRFTNACKENRKRFETEKVFAEWKTYIENIIEK